MQEDRILIRIVLRNKLIDSIDIKPRQFLRASRVLEGKTQDEALALLPMIYHVCARAHTFAAQQAFASAQGMHLPALPKHQLLVFTETCREHARRVFMDWPVLCGLKADTEAVLEIQGCLGAIDVSVQASTMKSPLHMDKVLLSQIETLQGLLEPLNQIITGAGSTYHSVSAVLEAIKQQAMAEIGRSDVPSMCISALDSTYLAEQLRSDTEGEFIAAPHLLDQVYETGPLARMRNVPLIKTLTERYGNGVLPRFCAMVLEMARIPQAMLSLILRDDSLAQHHCSLALAPGTGMGGVEAARGFLWHRVELAQGRVKRYQILAPTEWNFHPRGALFRGLHGLQFQAKNQLHKLASMVTTALDPCVSTMVELV